MDFEQDVFYINDEDVEITNGIYSYHFTLDLNQEITDIKTAATLLTFERNNITAMEQLFDKGVNVVSLEDLIAIANKLRHILLENNNITNMN